MTNDRQPASVHGHIAAVLAALSTLIAWASTSNFGDVNHHSDATITVLAFTFVVAAVAILTLSAHAFDHTYREASFFEALVRLIGLMLGLHIGAFVALSAVTLVSGLDEQAAGVLVTVALAPLMFATRVRAMRAIKGAPSPVALNDAATLPETITTASLIALEGPPQWPTEPPAAQQVTSTAVEQVIPPPEPPSPTPPRSQRSWAHRITSGLIAVGWIPLGAIVLFLANWCPNDGTADAVAITSLIYVVVQLLGNPLAGWFYDRRFGSTGGTMLAIGRSMLTAVVLMTTVGFTLSLFIPDGSSNYCG